MPPILLVFFGGGLGAVCRYLVTTQVGARFGTVFPFGTLTVNTVGSFLMGLVMGVLLLLAEQHQFAAGPWKLLLTVGFLGGFTIWINNHGKTKFIFEIWGFVAVIRGADSGNGCTVSYTLCNCTAQEVKFV